MSLYPKYGVYKILLEISGLKKSVVINDLSLKPMSLNPKFTVIYISNLFVCSELNEETGRFQKLILVYMITSQQAGVSSWNFQLLTKL